MITDIFYPILILTITILVCFLRRKKNCSGVSHPQLQQAVAWDPLQGLQLPPPPDQSSPFDAITRAHASTLAKFDRCKKWHTPLLFMTLIYWDIGTEKMIKRLKTSNWIVDHFSLIFVNFRYLECYTFYMNRNKGKMLSLLEWRKW